MNCPYGGICADSGQISQCDLNNACIFSSSIDKKKFDSLLDFYYVRSRNGELLKFKTRNQVDFYLNDFGGIEVLND